MSLRVNLLQFLTDYGHLNEIERQCCAYTARRMNESRVCQLCVFKITHGLSCSLFLVNFFQEIMAVYKLALLIDPVQLLEANGKCIYIKRLYDVYIHRL